MSIKNDLAIILFFVFFLAFLAGSEAQKLQINYQFELLDDQDTSGIEFPQLVDSSLIVPAIQKTINALHTRSFLAANLDSISYPQAGQALVHIYVGKQIRFGNLNWVGIEKEWLKHPSLRQFDLDGKLAKKELFARNTKALLTQMEEIGFPLAKIQLTNKRIAADSLSADIALIPGDLILFGGIEQDTANIIGNDFLERYLNIQQGQVFQMSKINAIESQINQLPYARLSGTPSVRIIAKKAFIKLKFKEIPSSRFDLLIGVLPRVESETKLTISGEFTADFKNKLHRGEEVYFHFRQLRPETQRIDFNVTYPYLFNLPFGVHGLFSLYRNGVESRDLNTELGIQYRSANQLESRFFINYKSSRLIEIDTITLLSSRALPSSLDVQSNNIGARLSSDRLDYRFNPQRGYFLELSATAGVRTILPNNQITELSNSNVNFSTAYDSLDLSVFQTAIESDFIYHIPIKKQSTVRLQNRSGVKWNQSQVFFNEYYRIGGSGILRGFDEESIRAQYYSVFTAEYRYLLSQNSYFSGFIDYGLVYNDFKETAKWDQPLGFGVGLSFQTQAGIFGLDVALGREQGNSLDFRNAKTHFGFISLF